ncbi:MAG: hypothetical protein WC314_14240 [Vulcanimicrobiota bacterium]
MRIVTPAEPVLENQPFVVRLREYAWGNRPQDRPVLEAPAGWAVTPLFETDGQRSFRILPNSPAEEYLLRARWGEAEVSKPLKLKPPGQAKFALSPPLDAFPLWAAELGLEHLISKGPPLYVVGLGEIVKVSLNMDGATRTFTFRGEQLGKSRIYPLSLEAELAVVPNEALPFASDCAPRVRYCTSG